MNSKLGKITVAVVSMALLALVTPSRHVVPLKSGVAVAKKTASVAKPEPESQTPEPQEMFFAIDAKHGIRVDIFKWNAHAWQEQRMSASPGDRIGSMDGTSPATDFNTGWTLVDIREDPAGDSENKLLILASDDGKIMQHSITADRQNPEYRKVLFDMRQMPNPAPKKAMIAVE